MAIGWYDIYVRPLSFAVTFQRSYQKHVNIATPTLQALQRQSEKERRKLISHSLGKSKQKRNKRWWCWWQYTNQSSVQKIRPAAINGLSHRERQPRHTTPYNGSIGRFQLPVFATIFLKSLKQPRCLEVIEAIKTEAVWVLFASTAHSWFDKSDGKQRPFNAQSLMFFINNLALKGTPAFYISDPNYPHLR